MRKFIIKNYKNIGIEKEVSLNLPTNGGLCVILGENNAGKSNVLGALRAFGEATLAQSDIPNIHFLLEKILNIFQRLLTTLKTFLAKKKKL